MSATDFWLEQCLKLEVWFRFFNKLHLLQTRLDRLCPLGHFSRRTVGEKSGSVFIPIPGWSVTFFKLLNLLLLFLYLIFQFLDSLLLFFEFSALRFQFNFFLTSIKSVISTVRLNLSVFKLKYSCDCVVQETAVV